MVAKEHREHSSTGRLTRAMRSTVGRESTTFGFSILVTATFGILQNTQGVPDVVEIFLYAAGAVMSFTVLEGILSRGFRGTMPQHGTKTLALGTSANILSVCLGLAAGLGIAALMAGPFTWAVAPFAASVVYLVAESLETAVAEQIFVRSGDPTADDVTP